MTDETTPARPSLATFLQGAPAAKPATPPQEEGIAEEGSAAVDADQQTALELPLAAPAGEPEVAVEMDTLPVQDDIAYVDDLDSPAAAPSSASAAPSFLRTGTTPRTGQPGTPRWHWGLVAGLVVLLAAQVIIADRARLAADAGSRPLVAGLCSVLRCSLPAWHEPEAFSMLSRDIRPVPNQAGALQVQASFRNDARWAQAWPALRLSLSDADGRVIGRRTLQPADYLGNGADPLARLEPGQSAQVSFRLREPAAATVAFSFEFQ